MKKALSWLVYTPLQLAAVPFTIPGVALAAYRQLVISRKRGISQTATEVFIARWALHHFGMRPDAAADKLLHALTNTSAAGVKFALWPLHVKAKIAKAPALFPRPVVHGEENLFDLMTSRTFHFDRVIQRHLPSVEQFVLMGAGMDTRAYGVLPLGSVKAFEVDQAKMQDYKREMLNKAGVESAHVTFVKVDFSTDDFFQKLALQGYDSTKKTIFLWEGVTLYLTEAAVRDTMVKIKSESAPGSIVVADLYGHRLLSHMRTAFAQKVLDFTDEPTDFSLDLSVDEEAVLRDFVESTGLKLGEANFIGGASKDGPFASVTEMLV